MKMRKNDQLESFVNYRSFMHVYRGGGFGRLGTWPEQPVVECYTIIEFFVFLLASGEGKDKIFGERQIEIYGVAEAGWRGDHSGLNGP